MVEGSVGCFGSAVGERRRKASLSLTWEMEKNMEKNEVLDKIKAYARSYADGAPVVSDKEYDGLVRRYNEIMSPEGGLVRPPVVGSDLIKGKRIAFPAPMLSLDNAFDVDQRSQGVNRIVGKLMGFNNVTFSAGLKIDGVAVAAWYKDGQLVAVANRGNGTIGENVFDGGIRMADLPFNIPVESPGTVIVTGEGYMRFSDFLNLNEERREAGEDEYASPRNTVAGAFQHSDPDEVSRRRVRFFAHGILWGRDPSIRNECDLFSWFSRMGFNGIEWALTGLRDAEDVEGAFRTLADRIQLIDYPCDGVVIKLDDMSVREVAGQSSTSPNWAFACKLEAQRARTHLLDVTYQVGRTGAITPVAEVYPVVVGDVTVRRITLHNKGFVERLDLRETDEIVIKRAGDVIPAVESVDPRTRTGLEKIVEFPSLCPECGTALYEPVDEARIYCPNSLGCRGQLQRSIEFWVGRDYMNLEGIGPKQIETVIRRKLVGSIPDIYRLRAVDLAGVDGFQSRKIQNLLAAVRESKQRPLSRLLASLGIRKVGRSASRLIASKYRSMEAILELTASYKPVEERSSNDELPSCVVEMMRLEGFGLGKAELFCLYMANERNRTQLDELAALGLNMVEPELEVSAVQSSSDVSSALPLAGLNVCATGKLYEYTRQSINDRIAELGGVAQSSVSSKTNLLIAGEKAGSKLQKAQKLGVRIVSESEFEEMCP